jgi:hypothetical protein
MTDVLFLAMFAAYLGGTVCQAVQTGSWRDWIFVPAWLVLVSVQVIVLIGRLS